MFIVMTVKKIDVNNLCIPMEVELVVNTDNISTFETKICLHNRNCEIHFCGDNNTYLITEEQSQALQKLLATFTLHH